MTNPTVEKDEPKVVRKRTPKPKAEQTKPEVLGAAFERIQSAIAKNEWTADKHRANPQWLTGVILSSVVPDIVGTLE